MSTTADEDSLCPFCLEEGSTRPHVAEAWYDRHGIYSGRACVKHHGHLPGQGSMWNYEAEESVEADSWGDDSWD